MEVPLVGASCTFIYFINPRFQIAVLHARTEVTWQEIPPTTFMPSLNYVFERYSLARSNLKWKYQYQTVEWTLFICNSYSVTTCTRSLRK
jgi:hypothetical protein